MDSLSLLELNALVRRSLEQCLPDEYWIQAEVTFVPIRRDIAIWNSYKRIRVAIVS